MGSLLRDLSCFMLQQDSAVSQFPVQITRMTAASHQIHTADSNKEIERVSLLDSVAEGVLSFTIRERCNSQNLYVDMYFIENNLLKYLNVVLLLQQKGTVGVTINI